jgi:signal transduction histidine kinase
MTSPGGGGLIRRTVLAAGLLALIVGAAFTVVLLAIADMRDAAVLARHSEQVLAAANPLERLSAAGDVEQGRLLRQIVQAGESYIREYSVSTVDAARRDPASARAVAVVQERKRRVDALRIEFDRFAAFEGNLAVVRQERSSAAAREATFAATAGIAGSVLLVALLTGYLTRRIVRAVRRAAAMAGRLAAGDFGVRLPETGAAEMGTLQRAFNTMGSSLETSHNELRRLVAEQAAVRRVATLVARGVSPSEVFDGVCGEVARLLNAPVTRLLRYEPDGTATVVARWGELAGEMPIGGRHRLEGESVATKVLRTGRAARMETYENAAGCVAAQARTVGIRFGVGGPIVVEGRLWGMIGAVWTEPGRLPAGIEGCLAHVTELVTIAIANADSRTQLSASRARVVAAADETRRGIERDLHDGTQQRLVSLALDARAAEASVPPELVELRAQLSQLAEGLTSAVDDLQEISRGIHPAILSQGGLRAALKTLARRSPVPVKLDLSADRRLPQNVEVAVYYLVSEALTNVAKHAHASVVHVDLEAEDTLLQLSVRDDGVGGAHPEKGSGLIGLRDRIEALGGKIDMASPEGKGTALLVKIPLADRFPAGAESGALVSGSGEAARHRTSTPGPTSPPCLASGS